MARQHVIIRREQWVAGTREKPEVGVFTQTHTTRPPVPWNKLLAGETMWMKWSSGPIVARAVVQGDVGQPANACSGCNIGKGACRPN